jgi:hypothetical protein
LLPWSLGTTKVLLGIFLEIPNLLGYKLGDNGSNAVFNAFNAPWESASIVITVTLFDDDDIL